MGLCFVHFTQPLNILTGLPCGAKLYQCRTSQSTADFCFRPAPNYITVQILLSRVFSQTCVTPNRGKPPRPSIKASLHEPKPHHLTPNRTTTPTRTCLPRLRVQKQKSPTTPACCGAFYLRRLAIATSTFLFTFSKLSHSSGGMPSAAAIWSM